MMAAIAAVTSRVEFGPLVACTNFHNPALLAKQAATIDEISGGRLVLGLGAGWNETEFRAFGFPFDHRIDRFEEAFTIIRTLLREGAIDFDGRFYQARDCELLPRGPRPAGPPLMVGSKGPRMLAITLPHVDAWNVWYTDTGNRPAGVPAMRTIVDDVCRDVGRDPAAIERTVAVQVRMPGGRGRQSAPIPRPCRPWRDRRSTSPTSCAPTPPRGSTTSSWSSTRSIEVPSTACHRYSRPSNGPDPRDFRTGRRGRGPVLASRRHATLSVSGWPSAGRGHARRIHAPCGVR